MGSPLGFFVLLSFVAVNTAAAQQVRDSAGAKVVSYSASARAAATWSVDPKALLRIGGADGEGPTEFAQIIGVVRLADGRVAVGDAGSTEVRLFSPTGSFLRTIGRKGQGPGEYEGLQTMLRSADTLLVQDRQSRLQVFNPNGTLLRSHARPVFPGRGVVTWQGMLGDGSGVVQGVDPTVDTTADVSTTTISLGLRAATNESVRAFTQLPAFERERRNGRLVALFLGGVPRVAVMGQRICSGYSLQWDVQCFDRTGKLLSRTRRDVVAGPVTEGDKEEFRRGYMAANRNQPPDNVRAAIARIEFAPKRPMFGRFVPSQSGELWIGPFLVLESNIPGRRGPANSDKPSTWTVLGTDGRWIAEVTLPPRFSLLDAGRDYVAGVELDADDVESVVVYRLRR